MTTNVPRCKKRKLPRSPLAETFYRPCSLFILVLVAVSIGWIPILMANQGGQLWDYLQAMQAYLAPPWVVVFLLGIAWKRTTEQVAVVGRVCERVHATLSLACAYLSTLSSVFVNVYMPHCRLCLSTCACHIVVCVCQRVRDKLSPVL